MNKLKFWKRTLKKTAINYIVHSGPEAEFDLKAIFGDTKFKKISGSKSQSNTKRWERGHETAYPKETRRSISYQGEKELTSLNPLCS